MNGSSCDDGMVMRQPIHRVSIIMLKEIYKFFIIFLLELKPQRMRTWQPDGVCVADRCL